jgi:hypothetical protein
MEEEEQKRGKISELRLCSMVTMLVYLNPSGHAPLHARTEERFGQKMLLLWLMHFLKVAQKRIPGVWSYKDLTVCKVLILSICSLTHYSTNLVKTCSEQCRGWKTRYTPGPCAAGEAARTQSTVVH